VTIEIRSESRRAANRVLGVYIVGAGGIISFLLMPALVQASSGSHTDRMALLQLLFTGALVWFGVSALTSIVGYFMAHSARRAAAGLRANGVEAEIGYGRLAPENYVVALTPTPGSISAWIDWGYELREVGRVSEISSVALTAQKMSGAYYYALQIESPTGSMMITLGTRSTWGLAEASRRAHLRLANDLLGTRAAASAAS
jgi:hypothetical protein